MLGVGSDSPATVQVSACDDDGVTGTPPLPIRWALAGYGSGGRIFHAPLIASAPSLEFAAVVTGSAARVAQVRHELPGVATVPDLDALVGLGVRGVTISTPPDTHVPLARRALRAGLHVVLDKPFALTAADAAGLLADAETSGRLLVPYVNRRWDNDFLTVRHLVASGRLGAVHRLTSRLDRCRPVKPGWASDPAAGGGTLLDLGPHLIDQALMLLGPAVTVYAEMDVRRAGGTASDAGAGEARRHEVAGPGRGARSEPSGTTEDDIQLHLRHASGARSTLAAGLASPATGPRFLIQGATAGVRIEGFDIQEAQLKAGSSPLLLGDRWGVDPDATAVLTDRDGMSVTMPLDRGRWHTFYPAVAGAVRGDGPVPADPRDAVATAQVIDAARESARTGRVVTVAPSEAGRRMTP